MKLILVGCPLLIFTYFFVSVLYYLENKTKRKSIFPLLDHKNICEAMSEPIKHEKNTRFFSHYVSSIFKCITRGGGTLHINISIGIRRFYSRIN
ncbi:hypothetical protein CW304_27555 [Bacillus sp. UFRGS-B20]|nr:hypothetical protein CW304_27555 [Bacillus sp. UFRGS-B20]